MPQKKLSELAKEINTSTALYENSRVAMIMHQVGVGKTLILIKKRLPLESNLTFGEWCKKNLRTPHGTELTKSFIEGCIALASSPEWLKSRLEATPLKPTARSRKWRANKRKAIQLTKPLFEKGTPIADQVNLLVTAWDHSSDEARKEFFEIIGARFK